MTRKGGRRDQGEKSKKKKGWSEKKTGLKYKVTCQLVGGVDGLKRKVGGTRLG